MTAAPRKFSEAAGRWPAPEPAQEAELDEAGQPALGRPQLPIEEERCELRRHDVAHGQPEQEMLVAGGQGGPDGTGPRGA